MILNSAVLEHWGLFSWLSVELLQGFCYSVLLMSSLRRVHVYPSNEYFTPLRPIPMVWKVRDTDLEYRLSVMAWWLFLRRLYNHFHLPLEYLLRLSCTVKALSRRSAEPSRTK